MSRRSPVNHNQLEFDIGLAVGSNVDSDGFLEIQRDAEGEQESGVPAYQAHFIHGLYTCPLDPEVDSTGQPIAAKACQMLFAYEGGTGHAWALEDPRSLAILPTPQPGEAILASDFGHFSRYKADGSIIHCTTTNGGSQKNGARDVWEGIDCSEAGQPKFMKVAPWGTEKFDTTGYRLKFGIDGSGGARLTLGYQAGGAPPFDGGQYYLRLQGDAIAIIAKGIVIADEPTNALPVAKAAPLVAVLQALGTCLIAHQAVLNSLTPGPVQGATVSAAGAAVAAVTAAQTALTGAIAAISTNVAIG